MEGDRFVVHIVRHDAGAVPMLHPYHIVDSDFAAAAALAVAVVENRMIPILPNDAAAEIRMSPNPWNDAAPESRTTRTPSNDVALPFVRHQMIADLALVPAAVDAPYFSFGSFSRSC